MVCTCVCSETDPNWDLDIGNDVKDESEKYGQVVHHYVDKNSKVGSASSALYLQIVVPCNAMHVQSYKHLTGVCFVF